MDRCSQQENANPPLYRHILEHFLNSYMVERNAEKTIALVTDDIYSLGTGVHEIACNKAEFKQLIDSEMAQINTPITYVLNTYREKEIAPDVFVCLCDVTTSIRLGDQPAINYNTRLTAGFRKVNGTFLAYHLHMSEASASQEEFEFFPMHYGAVESRKIDTDEQMELVELMKRMLPGGAMGGYVEPGFPLYFINDELLNHLGYTYDEFIADNGQMMSNTMHPDDVAMVEAAINDAFAAGNEYAIEYRMKKKDHSYIWVRDIGRKTIVQNGRVAIVSIIVDISDERLRQQSFEKTITEMKKDRRRIDRMTGVLNREPAEILIEQHLIREKNGAFFLMDIDNFKMVNDFMGHPEGDQVLHRLAKSIIKVFPESAVIARLGGDEFVAFLPEFEDEKQLCVYAEQLIKASRHLVDDAFLSAKIGISIGIAVAPKHGTDMKTLYANADKGLYFTKRNGKNGYSFFEQSSELPTTHDEGDKNATIYNLRHMVQSVLTDRGAFLVEYDTFNKMCQFALRNASRLQFATQIVLFSLLPTDNVNPLQMEECRNLLEQSIRYGLRTGDLLMNFGTDQIAVLLVNCSSQNADMVAARVMNAYRGAEFTPKADVIYESCRLEEKSSD